MDKNLKKMIDNVADGDMAAAGDAFNAAADARRQDAWKQAKIDYAQKAFKEIDLGHETSGVDTGITGDPAEVEEEVEEVDEFIGAVAKGVVGAAKVGFKGAKLAAKGVKATAKGVKKVARGAGEVKDTLARAKASKTPAAKQTQQQKDLG